MEEARRPGAKRKPGCILWNLTRGVRSFHDRSLSQRGWVIPLRSSRVTRLIAHADVLLQAWSVAEIPRVYLENVRDLRPICDQVATQR
jgi:hypothetical protein